MMKAILFLSFLSLVFCGEVDLDSFIEEQMEIAHIPSLVGVVVQGSEYLWTGYFGQMNQTTNSTPETSYMLASVSKTLMSVTLMQLYDDGLFQLDDDINDYLDFTVENPKYSNIPITFRQLLAHTSSISDKGYDAHDELYLVQGDSDIPLRDFLYNYLDKNGAHYSAKMNYNPVRPGSAHTYSNVGASLAGYLVEALLNGTQSFDEQCSERIFKPLEMENTGWHLYDFENTDEIALPIVYQDIRRKYKPLCQYGYPDYPSGQLRSSSFELARFFSSFINYGVRNGTRILEEDTAAMMRVPQPPLTSKIGIVTPGQALIWYYRVQADRVLLGHSGGDMGVATDMFFNPYSGVGYIILTNGDWDQSGYEEAIGNIEEKLLNAFDQPWPPQRREEGEEILSLPSEEERKVWEEWNRAARKPFVRRAKKSNQCPFFPCC